MIGERGENLITMLLTQKTSEGYLFRAAFLGDKWPTVDIYAEVIGETPRMFCFFQIKTTTLGYSKKQNQLKVQVSRKDLTELGNYCAPTYLIGVDLNEEEILASSVYVQNIKGSYEQGLSAMNTSFILNDARLIALKNEVVKFWQSTDLITYKLTHKSEFETND